MNTSENKLNKEQISAIEHGEGPLLIIAGAGTGKTTVITERIRYLITKKKVKPSEILALTFTEKAATEMQERVDISLPLSYGDVSITTFHSFCDRILRDETINVGLPGNYKLMDTSQSIDFIKKNIFDFDLDYFRPLGNPNKFIYGLLQHFSRLQDETITPENYLEWSSKLSDKGKSEEELLENKKWRELSKAYKFYDDLKIREGRFDFGDLIIKTLELFTKRTNILLNYQQKFKYILVDEFQDTNFAQNDLVNKLSQKHKNITIVGDDNQSIYRFRGAAISNIIQFKERYPKAKIVTLNKNYRSTQEILDHAYKLVKHNNPDTLEVKLGISKRLISVQSKKLEAVAKEKGDDIKFIHTKDVSEEADEVAKEILNLTKSKFQFKDIAILVRANNHADPFIREFERKGIPHQFLGPSSLFEKEEIVDLISYLKVLYNVEDSASLYRLISSNFLNVNQLEVLKLNIEAKKKSISLFDLIAEKISQEKEFSPTLSNMFDVINKHLNAINKLSAGEILLEFIKEVGIYENLLKNEEDSKAINISKFFERIKKYENENKKASVLEIVDYIDLLQEVGEGPMATEEGWQENNSVNILTVHSSKGLEFPVVFLVNLVSERFPSRERKEQVPIPDDLIKETLPKGDFHIQEERRLFYVGMTRAKKKLYLTASSFYGDGKREKKISPFVYESLEDLEINKNLDKSKFLNFEESIKVANDNKKEKIKIDYLSVSQIETFEICPLHYKLKYIYKIPTEPTASISFGISMHSAMRDFYKEIETAVKPSEKLILKVFENNFMSEGFINKKQKNLFFERGKDYLKDYLKKSFNKNIKPPLTESKFEIEINKDLKIGGTFDRVDFLPDGGLEIIDYKTGDSIPTQKDLDKNLQLGVYALAATKLKSELFDKKPEEVKLSLYFFNGQQKITTTRTIKELNELEVKLLETKLKIENSDFKCSKGYFCQGDCEYSIFCKSS